MKISIISPYLPSLSSGSAVRTYNLLKRLAQKNDVTLFCGSYLNSDKEQVDFIKNIHKKTYFFSYPNFTLSDRIKYYLQNKIPYIERLRQSDFNNLLQYIPHDTDAIHIAEFQAYSVVEPYLDKLPGKKVLDAHNVDYLRLKSEFDSSPLLRKVAGYPLVNKLKTYEIQAIQKMDYVLTCSQQDKNIYSQYKNDKDIKVIPNGVDLKILKKDEEKEVNQRVLFMGNLSYSPNAFGIKWYLENVHPILVKDNNDYQIVIIGMNPPQWMKQLSDKDSKIVLKGFVDNIQKEISQAQVCICPILSGSGTRLKLLEYMALKKAVVSTTQGAEGIDVKNELHLLLTDTPHSFADSMSKLFNNQHLRKTIGVNGFEMVSTYYTWDKIVNRLNIFYKSL